MSRVPLARRNAFADRQRLAIAVVGVGLAIGLIFLLQGLWQGFQVQISSRGPSRNSFRSFSRTR
jgi:hypothetical protein